MSKVFLHIGLHKTGTTYLQTSVFPELKGITSFSLFNHIGDIALHDNDKLLLSCECFCGNPWKGNYYNEFEQQVLNLKKLFPESAVIIGFREQLPMITSLYKQFIQRGGTRDVSYLFNTENTGILKHEDFLYVKKIEFLKKHFDHIFYYTQEDLRKSPQLVINDLCDFLELNESLDISQIEKKETNTGIKSVKQLQILRKSNLWSHRLRKIHPILSPMHAVYQHLKITPRDFIQFKGFFKKGKPFKLNDELQKFITEYYATDWEETQKLIKQNI